MTRLIIAARAAIVLVLLAILPALVIPQPINAQSASPTWSVLDAAGPPARWDHTLAADPQRGALVLFGGRDAGGAPFGDTWLYTPDEQAWMPIDVPGPSPRFGQAVAVDADSRALFLFGGQADGDTFFNDVWRFDLDALTWTEMAASEPRPAPRYGTSAVLDDAGRLLISHGFTFEGRFDDTWAFDPASGVWSDLSPAPETRPLKRCLHEAVWDADLGRMLLYGGCSSGFGPCPQGDLWAFDPAARAWTELTPVESPAARSNPALIRDDNGAVWLTGGLTAAGYAADLWRLDLSGDAAMWGETPLADLAPDPRASHDAAFLNGALYLFGGYGNAGPLADLWVLEGGA